MTVKATTHINFKGDARAALEFYQSVFGGELTIITYKDMGNVQQPEEADQVMWGQVAADSGFAIMAYDVPAGRPYDKGVDPFFESLRGETVEEVTAIWGKLADGATITQPLAPAQWALPTACSPTGSASPGSSTSPLTTAAPEHRQATAPLHVCRSRPW